MTHVSTPILNPQLPNIMLDASWFYALWWVHWSIFAAQVSTRPFDYRLPPNSPQARINCHGHNPRHQVKFPNTNLSSYLSQDYQLNQSHWRGQFSRTQYTGLPKPPGYNLEWPCVTPIQVTLVTRPPAKHHIMTSIQSCVEILLAIQPCTQNCLAHLSRR